MDFAYSEDQNALRELARKILSDRLTPDRLREIERSEDRIDEELWAELARANLLGVAAPESAGGSGLGFVELCILLEEIGRAVAPVPAWASLVLGGLPLAEFGTPEQRERWLPALVRGEAMLTAALIEPDADDPLHPTTNAEKDGDGWRLSGEKVCVPAAHRAARVLVPARTGDGGVALFWVDPEADGATLERGIGTNREVQVRLRLAQVRVAAADRLAADAAAALGWILDRAVVGQCAMQLGVAERAVELTANYARQRQQFDRPIGSFQAVHQRAADAYVDLEAMRLTTQQAAWLLDQARPAANEIAIAKYWAAEGGHRVAYAAQHLHGGIGVDVEYPIHRYYLWERQIELTLGSAAEQLARLGDELARTPAPVEGA